jgi:hypothetical protein
MIAPPPKAAGVRRPSPSARISAAAVNQSFMLGSRYGR